jgi:monoamine oxidase
MRLPKRLVGKVQNASTESGVALTGWFGGRKTGAIARFNENELIEAGIESLADIFDLDPKQLTRNLVKARAINWANDPFARGAYSHATPEASKAKSALARPYDSLFRRSALSRAGHGYG